MYRRKRNRVKMVLGVRASGQASSGLQFDELAHTLDIAIGGVRLGGMNRIQLQPGDVIEIRRQSRKARFKVAWVGAPGSPRDGQIGLQGIDASPNFWGLEVPVEGEVPVTLPVSKPHRPNHVG